MTIAHPLLTDYGHKLALAAQQHPGGAAAEKIWHELSANSSNLSTAQAGEVYRHYGFDAFSGFPLVRSWF